MTVAHMIIYILQYYPPFLRNKSRAISSGSWLVSGSQNACSSDNRWISANATVDRRRTNSAPAVTIILNLGLNLTHLEGPGCPSNATMGCNLRGCALRSTAPVRWGSFWTSQIRILPSKLPPITYLLSGVHPTSSPLLPLDGSILGGDVMLLRSRPTCPSSLTSRWPSNASTM